MNLWSAPPFFLDSFRRSHLFSFIVDSSLQFKELSEGMDDVVFVKVDVDDNPDSKLDS